jgi:hyperosmotically inducible periplasmic protein
MNYTKVFMLSMGVALVTGLYVHAAELDDRIQTSAKESYVFSAYLKEEPIEIKSQDGNVVLTGAVSNTGHKALAQETVENLPGVKSVDNQLTIKNEEPSENSDAWLSMKVKAALLLHRNVNGINTKVYVKDGIVTLKGEAQSQSQKELTTEYAKDVEGVKDVTNEMSIVRVEEKAESPTLSDKIDDASITAQVKMALLSHKSTSAFRTKVQTKDGIVTVSGTAKNEAEKDLVTKLVMDINGVAGVHNEMVIQ